MVGLHFGMATYVGGGLAFVVPELDDVRPPAPAPAACKRRCGRTRWRCRISSVNKVTAARAMHEVHREQMEALKAAMIAVVVAAVVAAAAAAAANVKAADVVVDPAARAHRARRMSLFLFSFF